MGGPRAGIFWGGRLPSGAPPTLLVEDRGEATLRTIGPRREEGVLGHGLVAPCQVGVQPTPVLVTLGAEAAGSLVPLPFLVAPGLVVFLLVVAGVAGAGRLLAGGEGDGGVTLGLEVLLVRGLAIEPDGERVHLAHSGAERQEEAVRGQRPPTARAEPLHGFAEWDVDPVHRGG